MKVVSIGNLLAKSEKNDIELSEIRYKKFKLFGISSSLLFLCLAGSVQPSLINGVYFLSFLIFSTWLSRNRELGKKFSYFLKKLSVLLMFHLVAIALYQTPFLEAIVGEKKSILRMLGLSKIYTNHQELRTGFVFNSNLNLDAYLNPFILMATYLTITSTSRFILVTTVKDFVTSFINFWFNFRVHSSWKIKQAPNESS